MLQHAQFYANSLLGFPLYFCEEVTFFSPFTNTNLCDPREKPMMRLLLKDAFTG